MLPHPPRLRVRQIPPLRPVRDHVVQLPRLPVLRDQLPYLGTSLVVGIGTVAGSLAVARTMA